MSRKRSCVLAFFALVVALRAAVAAPQAGLDRQEPADIQRYISSAWDTLTRSMNNCESLADPKTREKPVLYVPADFTVPASVHALEKQCLVRVEHLPQVIEKLGGIDASKINPPGLLYLEHPYVVPGGMFNEMYGWDSYFILRGLLRERRMELARGIVENFFFEIDHYGAVLNANRTYYLTRSQPPFLTSMIRAVDEAAHPRTPEDVAWLAKAYRYAVKDYGLWTREPHLTPETGLSRYYDLGDGPVPELSGSAMSYYRYAAQYFLIHPESAGPYLDRLNTQRAAPWGPIFSLYLCNGESSARSTDDCAQLDRVGLTREFYKGDRSMRESGFDVSFRFGPFGAGTHHYTPVCLNSLLYKSEMDLAHISAVLGRESESRRWRQRAFERRRAIQRYLWDETRGLFLDYNFESRRRSRYEFATTFYPLWVGLASRRQARAIAGNLKLFEQPGGLAMSRRETQAQWDYPYGWAPIHLIATEGLRRYGYHAQANRIAYDFLSMVAENFRREHTLREKYNVVKRSSETQVEAGYQENVVGFGWTNGVFLELLHALPKPWAVRVTN